MRADLSHRATRRTVLDGNGVRQSGRWSSTRVQELLLPTSGVHSIEPYADQALIVTQAVIVRMVEQVKEVYPELRLDALGYVEILRHREVHYAGRWAQAVADGSISDCP